MSGTGAAESRTTRAALVAALVALLLVLRGWPAPAGNELIYLLAPYQAWHPGFLAGDFTFGRPWPEHWLFNQTFGAFTLVLPIPMLGWVGRLVYWSLGLWGLLAVGRRLGLGDGATAMGIALWLAIGQSLVGGDWMFKTFEAKSVAYVLLLFGVDRFLAGRELTAAALLGLSFSFHPSVGASAALGFGMVLLLRRTPPAAFARFVGWTFLWSLPGLIPLLPALSAPNEASRETWRIMALVRMPVHLDPARFPRRDIVALYLMYGFVAWFATISGDRALRFCRDFLTGLALLFTGGLVARATGRFELLQVFPFRVFPLLLPLIFLWSVLRAWRDLLRGARFAPALSLLGLLGLTTLPDPLGGIKDQVYLNQLLWRPADDLARTFTWIRANTPGQAVTILPPWRKESFYLAQRPQIVNWDAVRYERGTAWQERMEALCGPIELPGREAVRMELMQRHYDRLTPADLHRIVERYGGDYLVSRTAYDFPVAHQSGAWRVYRLTGASAP